MSAKTLAEAFEDLDAWLREERQCKTCDATKTNAHFPTVKKYKQGRLLDDKGRHCRECERAKGRQRRSDPAVRRAEAERTRELKFGITSDQFRQLMERQGGVCALCRQPEKARRRGKVIALAVDHDHRCCPGKRSCGKCVRGLLCIACNVNLGRLEGWYAANKERIDTYVRSSAF